MDRLNQESGSPPPPKRKRGRPRKDENLTQQEKTPITPKPDTATANAAADVMMGQVVSGVVEGSFDAGYFLNVKIVDTDKQLRGVVFIPEKVTPITAANDVAPLVKMYEREEISVPAFNQQMQPQGQENIEKQMDISPELQTGDLITDKNQSAPSMISVPDDHAIKDAGTGSELQSCTTATCKNRSTSDDALLPSDMLVKDIGIATPVDKDPMQQTAESGPKNQALPLMPQSGNDGFYEQHNTVLSNEASGISTRSSVDTAKPDSVTAGTPFVDFFPNRETTRPQNPNLEFFRNETKLSGNEGQKSPARAEPRGFDLMTENPTSPMDNVPEELQLELGNKTMSGANLPHLNGGFQNDVGSNTIATNPHPALSMSGFLANLFEGEATAAESDPAAPQSGLRPRNEVDDSSATSIKVDCNMREAISPVQSQNPLISN